MSYFRTTLIGFYTENQEIADYASPAFIAFSIAFFFDWAQC